MTRYVSKLSLSALMMFMHLNAELIFYDRDAGIEVKNTSTLEIATATLRPIDGTIVRDAGGFIIGERFFFNNGILSDGDFEILLTATYDPNKTFSLELSGTTGGGSAFYFVNNPGFIPHKLEIRGVNNRIEGLPSYVNDDPITLGDVNTTVTFALQRELNQSIVLNGGTVILDDDLIFDESVKFNGTGKIIFDGNNIIFGTETLSWTDTIEWVGGENIILNGDAILTSQWVFNGDAHIIGNNNILDISGGGTIFVKSGSSLLMSNLNIVGLGSGFIEFEDKTSEVELYECRLDMNTDYTFTTGGFYISGESTVVTRDKILTFDLDSSVTVNSTTLFYDTLDFKDIDNIITFTENGTKNGDFIDGGSIRYKASNKIGDENFDGNTFLDRPIIINRKRNLIVRADTEIDGRSQSITFGRLANEPIVILQAGNLLKFVNVLLKDFPVVNTEMQIGSQLIFGDDTTIELAENATLDKVFEFEGNVLLNGRNKTLVMGPGAQFILRPGAQLTLDDIKLKGITADKIVMYDNTCTVSFGDVEWTQDDSYTFSNGQFEVLGRLTLKGTGTFEMATGIPCTVRPIGTIEIDAGPTFLYAPSVANRDLLRFVDQNSILFLSGGTLASTTTGLRLTKGTLVIDSKSFLRNDGAVSLSEGIAIGNGIITDDFEIKIEPAATLELLSGLFVYQNVA